MAKKRMLAILIDHSGQEDIRRIPGCATDTDHQTWNFVRVKRLWTHAVIITLESYVADKDI